MLLFYFILQKVKFVFDLLQSLFKCYIDKKKISFNLKIVYKISKRKLTTGVSS